MYLGFLLTLFDGYIGITCKLKPLGTRVLKVPAMKMSFMVIENEVKEENFIVNQGLNCLWDTLNKCHAVLK